MHERARDARGEERGANTIERSWSKRWVKESRLVNFIEHNNNKQFLGLCLLCLLNTLYNNCEILLRIPSYFLQVHSYYDELLDSYENELRNVWSPKLVTEK